MSSTIITIWITISNYHQRCQYPYSHPHPTVFVPRTRSTKTRSHYNIRAEDRAFVPNLCTVPSRDHHVIGSMVSSCVAGGRVRKKCSQCWEWPWGNGMTPKKFTHFFRHRQQLCNVTGARGWKISMSKFPIDQLFGCHADISAKIPWPMTFLLPDFHLKQWLR